MKLLYSNIPPLSTTNRQETIVDCLNEQIHSSEEIKIAVGYVSQTALEEIDRLVDLYRHQIKHITIIIGMYYIEGIPESSYHVAMDIHKKWFASGIGEIKLFKPLKYHGKLYCFYNSGKPVSAVIGSANLGILKADANNRRQYEIASITTDYDECKEISDFIVKLENTIGCENIDQINGIKLIRDHNVSLDSNINVDQFPPSTVKLYEKHKTDIEFILPIKVPAYKERFMDDGKHFTKSNINVCYAAPRSARKPRNWYEVQFTVDKEIRTLPGYPIRDIPFYVITDDGYWFKAHTTSDSNKQFSAVGDELLLGRWIKGSLAAAGLVKPANNPLQDEDRQSMITKAMLQAYGKDSLKLTKTDQKAIDESGNELDVWMLSFVKA